VEANSTGGQGSRRAVAPSDDDLFISLFGVNLWAGIAQSVKRLATDWTVRIEVDCGGRAV
jgi:hypothetical protein